jgi:hypothetical protein
LVETSAQACLYIAHTVSAFSRVLALAPVRQVLVHELQQLTCLVGVLVVQLRILEHLLVGRNVLHLAGNPGEVVLLQIANPVERAEECLNLSYGYGV